MTFGCKDVHDRWSEYVYRELDEPGRAQVDKHIQNCPDCAAEEAEWAKLLARFDSMTAFDGQMEVPPELVYRVKRQVRLYEDWSRQTYAQVRNWAVGFVMACMLLAGSAMTFLTQYPAFRTPRGILGPVTHSVRNSFYDEETLALYLEKQLFQQEQRGEIATAPQQPEPAGEQGIDAPNPAASPEERATEESNDETLIQS